MLNEFGFGSLDLKKEDFTSDGSIIQLGFPPKKIDILTSLSGVNRNEVYKSREKEFCSDIPVFFIGRNEIIKNKLSLGRQKD